MSLPFFIYKSPQYVLPIFESIGLLVQESSKYDFQDQDGGRVGCSLCDIMAACCVFFFFFFFFMLTCLLFS